jgi:UDP-N-acetylmuramoyl-tripeptide--D-alanyl-D-alanine ligase
MRPLTLHQLHEIVGGRLRLATLGPRDGEWTEVPKFSADSRQLQPGEAFWALSGRNQNGHDFVDSAFARGASGVVAARYFQPWPGCWSLQVDDSREALLKLARWHREQFEGRLITVGGVAGTATTRRLIDTVLSSVVRGVSCPQRSHRADSIALGMLGLESRHAYAVFDLNLSGPGDISSLVEECQPTIGVITDVTKPRAMSQHSAKVHDSTSQLLGRLPSDGHAVLCGGDAAVRAAAVDCRAKITWVGETDGCDIQATRVLGTQGRLHFIVDGQEFHVPAWGRHQLTSILCAIGVGRLFGMSLAEIAFALESFDSPPPNADALTEKCAEESRTFAEAAPSIIKFQQAAPHGKSIIRSLRHVAGEILRFDPSHHLKLRPAA